MRIFPAQPLQMALWLLDPDPAGKTMIYAALAGKVEKLLSGYCPEAILMLGHILL